MSGNARRSVPLLQILRDAPGCAAFLAGVPTAALKASLRLFAPANSKNSFSAAEKSVCDGSDYNDVNSNFYCGTATAPHPPQELCWEVLYLAVTTITSARAAGRVLIRPFSAGDIDVVVVEGPSYIGTGSAAYHGRLVIRHLDHFFVDAARTSGSGARHHDSAKAMSTPLSTAAVAGCVGAVVSSCAAAVDAAVERWRRAAVAEAATQSAGPGEASAHTGNENGRANADALEWELAADDAELQFVITRCGGSEGGRPTLDQLLSFQSLRLRAWLWRAFTSPRVDHVDAGSASFSGPTEAEAARDAIQHHEERTPIVQQPSTASLHAAQITSDEAHAVLRALDAKERDLTQREARLAQFMQLYQLTAAALDRIPTDQARVRLFTDYYQLTVPSTGATVNTPTGPAASPETKMSPVGPSGAVAEHSPDMVARFASPTEVATPMAAAPPRRFNAHGPAGTGAGAAAVLPSPNSQADSAPPKPVVAGQPTDTSNSPLHHAGTIAIGPAAASVPHFSNASASLSPLTPPISPYSQYEPPAPMPRQGDRAADGLLPQNDVVAVPLPTWSSLPSTNDNQLLLATGVKTSGASSASVGLMGCDVAIDAPHRWCATIGGSARPATAASSFGVMIRRPSPPAHTAVGGGAVIIHRGHSVDAEMSPFRAAPTMQPPAVSPIRSPPRHDTRATVSARKDAAPQPSIKPSTLRPNRAHQRAQSGGVHRPHIAQLERVAAAAGLRHEVGPWDQTATARPSSLAGGRTPPPLAPSAAAVASRVRASPAKGDAVATTRAGGDDQLGNPIRRHRHEPRRAIAAVPGDSALGSSVGGDQAGGAADVSVASITSRGHHDSGVWLERHLRELDDLEARLAESNKHAAVSYSDDGTTAGAAATAGPDLLGFGAATSPAESRGARDGGAFRSSRRVLRFDE